MLLNPCFAALATPVTPYDKGKSLWIEQFSSVCLKGSHMLTCLTCFSHDLERPRAGKASAQGRSRSTGPGSTSPHPGTVRLRRDDGEKAHCARGGKEKQPAFPFLLPVLFSSQAGAPPHPYCSRGSTEWVEKWAHPKHKGFVPLNVPRITLLCDGVSHVDVPSQQQCCCALLSPGASLYSKIPVVRPLPTTLCVLESWERACSICRALCQGNAGLGPSGRNYRKSCLLAASTQRKGWDFTPLTSPRIKTR